MRKITLFIRMATLASASLLTAAEVPDALLADLVARTERLKAPLAAQTARTEALLADLQRRADEANININDTVECLRTVQDETLCAVSVLESCRLAVDKQKCQEARENYNAFMERLRLSGLSN